MTNRICHDNGTSHQTLCTFSVKATPDKTRELIPETDYKEKKKKNPDKLG